MGSSHTKQWDAPMLQLQRCLLLLMVEVSGLDTENLPQLSIVFQVSRKHY